MITKYGLEKILEEKLSKENIQRISSFSLGYILNSPDANEDSINKTYLLLKSYGLSEDKLASQAQLLGMNPETIEKNYQNLRSYGIRGHKIASRAELLGLNPETIEKNYQNLRSYGIRRHKITILANLIGRCQETIKRNYQNLRSYGLSANNIASSAELLNLTPETIEKNYQKAIGILRQNHQDRNSGREFITNNPVLLGYSPETIKENVQYLNSINLIYNNIALLGTKVQTKRGKMVWMLQNLFDYGNLYSGQKTEAVHNMYNFIRGNPNYLIRSISTLERQRDELRNRVIKDYYS